MIDTFLLDQCGLVPYRPLVVGVSGGPDSLCLLDTLHNAGFQIIVAHFNHGLRLESDMECAAVSALAEKLGHLFVTDTSDVRIYASEHHLSIEEAARLLRYNFLFQAARENAAQAVAVGHTADDQVETVLMHFLRGAGLAGLKGMEARSLLPTFDPSIPLVRPLLTMWRDDTEAYCSQHGLKPHYDLSNSDLVYFRNRIRHSLIPELSKYNPGFKSAILRTARVLQGDYSILQGILEDQWKDTVTGTGVKWIAFDAAGLNKKPLSIRRNLIRLAAVSIRPEDRDIGLDAIERAIKFIDSPVNGRMDFINDLYILYEGDQIYLATSDANLPTSQWPQIRERISLANTSCKLDEGWEFFLDWAVSPSRVAFTVSDNWDAWLDGDLIERDSLVVRSPHPGDRFQPLGMATGSIKLSDFFINNKLPARARQQWPLVCAAEQIIWVPGFRPAHPCRITPATANVLHLSLKKS